MLTCLSLSAAWISPAPMPSSGLTDSSGAQSLPNDASQSNQRAAERLTSEHQPIPSRAPPKPADSGKEKQHGPSQQSSQKAAGKQPAEQQQHQGEEKKKPTKAERRATQDRQRAEKAAAKVPHMRNLYASLATCLVINCRTFDCSNLEC